MRLRIYEIYDAIQGEGTLAGTPCTLVRLAGCPLRCRYCDTPEAIPPQSGEWMPLDAILQTIRQRDRPLVLVTGGEPLAQRHALDLLEGLATGAAIVQLETSGAYDIAPVKAPIRRILDIKTPGSGEAERNRWNNLEELRPGDEVKFVLTDRNDYDWAVDRLRHYRLEVSPAPVLFSPCWGMLDPRELAAWILEDGLNVRLQLQMHKYIWGEKATQV